VIVTGGASGLGAAISIAFVQEEAQVLVMDISKPVRQESSGDPLEKPAYPEFLGDVTLPQDIEQCISKGITLFGKIDILVNNAGVWPAAFVKDMPDEEWEQTLRINLTSAFMFSKRIIRHLIETGRPGKIINIVSAAAFQGSATGHSHYAAAKAGLVAFTVTLAKEVACYGINVIAVAPGIMRTPMTEGALHMREGNYLQRIPLGRLADPYEVANVVVFLASEKANYITGATIDVTGGLLMR